jgi:hypothetical protein
MCSKVCATFLNKYDAMQSDLKEVNSLPYHNQIIMQDKFQSEDCILVKWQQTKQNSFLVFVFEKEKQRNQRIK